MHLSSDRMSDKLSNIENVHLKSCLQCQEEMMKIKALRNSVEFIEILTPPEKSWADISAKMAHRTKSKKAKPERWKMITSLAASVALFAFGNITYQQVQMQNELTDLRHSNYILESQLIELKQNGNHSREMLKQVLYIEKELGNVTSKSEVVFQLKQRQLIMKAMIGSKVNGSQNEIITL